MQLTNEQIERAEDLRARLIAAEQEVVRRERKIARAIKLSVELSDRCNMKGIEGRLVGVSVTGAIISVKDAETKMVVDVPNVEIVYLEVV